MINIEIEMTTGDVIKAELYPDIAPITVENFVNLIKGNFFDGLIFHRVIKGFMIQGGGYNQLGDHIEAPSIKGEVDSNGVPNSLKHTRGVQASSLLCIRMLRTLTVNMPLSVRLLKASRLLTRLQAAKLMQATSQ